MSCTTCPSPANCSPTFCRFSDADLPVTMFEPPEQPAMTPSLARAANERIRRLEATKTPLRIRAWDSLGNLPHRLGRWVDRSPVLQMAGFAVGAVAACALAALVVMR